jgi:hypothetical protein
MPVPAHIISYMQAKAVFCTSNLGFLSGTAEVGFRPSLPSYLVKRQCFGGADETRTRDLLRDRQAF